MIWALVLQFAKRYWKQLAVVLVIFALGWGSAWKVQNVRRASVEEELYEYKHGFKACSDANGIEHDTVQKLEKDVYQARTKCERQLTALNNMLSSLRDADTLKEDSNETYSDGWDTLLDALNGLYPGGDLPGQICVPGLAGGS